MIQLKPLIYAKSLITMVVPTLFLALVSFPINNLYGLEIGSKVPYFTLESREGEKIYLGALKGKIVYLDFWASWCAACRQSLPWLSVIQERYKKQGLEVVTINLDNDREEAESLLSQLTPNYTVLFDPGGSIAENFNLATLPSSILIDRSGFLVAVHEGFKEKDRTEIEESILKALEN